MGVLSLVIRISLLRNFKEIRIYDFKEFTQRRFEPSAGGQIGPE
jgi:hypothetical protein